MIYLTRLNRVPLIVNSDLIEHIEVTPDTMVVLTSGEKYLVLEPPNEVIERVIRFRRAVCTAEPALIGQDPAAGEMARINEQRAKELRQNA
jgi:flagellar protein FlbD